MPSLLSTLFCLLSIHIHPILLYIIDSLSLSAPFFSILPNSLFDFLFSPDLGDFASEIYSIDMSSTFSIDTSQQGPGAMSKVMASASAPRSSPSTNKSKEELRKKKQHNQTIVR